MWLALLALSAAADDTDWKQLHSPHAAASSYLQSNWNKYTENYHPTYILDGNPKTAWVEGAKGNGEGSWITWPVSRVPHARRVKLRIRNGYHKSKNLLLANAAPSVVRIELRSGDRVVHAREAQLARDLTWQEVVLVPHADVPFDNVRLVVLAAHEGSAYADLCISDIETWIDAEVAHNKPVENAKHLAAMAWIKARVDAAAYFAKQPKEYPFAATQFRSEDSVEVSTEVARGWMSEHMSMASTIDRMLERDTPWRRLDVKDVPRLPEGVWLPDGSDRWFAADLAFFETDKEWRFRKKGDEHWIREDARSNVRVEMLDDGVTPHLAAFHTRRVVEERSTYTTTERWLVRFDEQGRTTEIFVAADASEDEMCKGWADRKQWTISRQDGRINRIELHRRNWCKGGFHNDEYVEPPQNTLTVWKPVT